MSESFVKMMRTEALDELISASPLAFVLAAVIAKRARWSESFNAHGLQPGEAFLGDYSNYGMSQQQYRTTKAQLEKWGFATFKATNKGTVAKLMDKRLFSVLPERGNGQANVHANEQDNEQDNRRVTTNLERIEGVEGKERESPRPQVAAESDPALPTIEEVKTYGDMRGIPAAYCENYHARCCEKHRWLVKSPTGLKLIGWQSELVRWWTSDRQNRKPAGNQAAPIGKAEPRLEDFGGDKAKWSKAHENWILAEARG